MDKLQDIYITSKEFYGNECLDDTLNQKNTNTRRPQGKVLIYEEDDKNKRQIIYRNNIIVYNGREMLAQRLVNVENLSVTSSRNEWLQWFGVGEGGVYPADPLNPIPSVNNDTDLYSPVMISTTTSSLYADPKAAGVLRGDGYVYPETGNYKKIFDQDEASKVTFERDNINDDKFLVIKITTTIGVNDANGKQLSEAGLFSAASSTGGYSGNFTLFAKITFPSLIKVPERRLIFVWYLYV